MFHTFIGLLYNGEKKNTLKRRFHQTQDPKGNVMKQMKNVTSGDYGVLEDFMIMDEEPVLGPWTITSTAYSHYTDDVYYSAKVNQMF